MAKKGVVEGKEIAKDDVYEVGDFATQYGYSAGFPGDASQIAYGTLTGDTLGNDIEDIVMLRQGDGFFNECNLLIHFQSGHFFDSLSNHFKVFINGVEPVSSAAFGNSYISRGGVTYREVIFSLARENYTTDPISWAGGPVKFYEV